MVGGDGRRVVRYGRFFLYKDPYITKFPSNVMLSWRGGGKNKEKKSDEK